MYFLAFGLLSFERIFSLFITLLIVYCICLHCRNFMNSLKNAYFKLFAFSNFRNFRVKYKFLFFLDTSRARSVQTRINGKFLINEVFLMNRAYLTSLRACFRHEHVFFCIVCSCLMCCKSKQRYRGAMRYSKMMLFFFYDDVL